jgi:hypothetical protein
LVRDDGRLDGVGSVPGEPVADRVLDAAPFSRAGRRAGSSRPADPDGIRADTLDPHKAEARGRLVHHRSSSRGSPFWRAMRKG